MRNSINEQHAIDKLRTLLLQKGYRRQFTVMVEGNDLSRFNGQIENCLAHFFDYCREWKFSPAHLLLETYAPYNDSISCRFNTEYREPEGFRIKAVRISKENEAETKVYQLQANDQLLGSMTLEGLFPKKKLWDRFKKGTWKP